MIIVFLFIYLGPNVSEWCFINFCKDAICIFVRYIPQYLIFFEAIVMGNFKNYQEATVQFPVGEHTWVVGSITSVGEKEAACQWVSLTTEPWWLGYATFFLILPLGTLNYICYTFVLYSLDSEFFILLYFFASDWIFYPAFLPNPILVFSLICY